MSNETAGDRAPGRDWAGVVVAAGLGVLGAVGIAKTEGMSALGAVFPKTIATALLVFAVVFILWTLFWPQGKVRQQEQGSWWRRVALVLIMLLWIGLLRWLGFVGASVIGFAGLVVVGNYFEWSARRVLIYAITSAALIGGFYALFALALNVPLPESSLF
jgi:putative tricarboxylic transport membrane protein